MLFLHYSRRRQEDSEVTLSTVILLVFRREQRDYVRALEFIPRKIRDALCRA